MLFDTGAMKSVMSLEMYKKLKLKDLNTTSIPHIVEASGKSLGARGRTKCEVNINGRIFYQTFIVCEHLKRPIILGRDFSIQNCIGISWTKTKTRQLTQNNKVIAETAEYQTPSRASVSLKKNIKIPPRSCAVVDVDINTTEEIKVEVIPDQLWLSANPNICTYPMIADLKEREPNTVTPFVIVNCSHHEHLHLPKDYVVAFTEKDCNKGEVLEICTMEQLEKELPRKWIPERKRQEKFSEFFKNPFMQKDDDFLKSPAVPFRLAQVPAYFQKLINDMLKGCNFAMGYLDNIIIYSRSEKEHLEHLKEIFTRLKAAGLKLKLEKCCFFKKHMQYLGHLISADGIQTLPEKLESITKMPAPRNPKEVKQFLGLVGYYRKFVPRFADISRVLTHLTKKDLEFKWTPECENCFQILKEFLQQAPIL